MHYRHKLKSANIHTKLIIIEPERQILFMKTIHVPNKRFVPNKIYVILE